MLATAACLNRNVNYWCSQTFFWTFDIFWQRFLKPGQYNSISQLWLERVKHVANCYYSSSIRREQIDGITSTAPGNQD